MKSRVWTIARSVSAVTIVGNAAYALAQAIVLVILVRFTGTTDVGRYAMALAITAPVQIGLGMRLRTARVINSPNQWTARTYLRLATVMGTIAIAVSLGIGLIAFDDQRTRLTILLIAGSKAMESLMDLAYGEMQRQGLMRRIALSQVLKGTLTVLSASAGLALEGGAVGAAAGIFCAWTAQLLLLELPRLLRGHTHPAKGGARTLATSSWPLGLASAGTSLAAAAPRYFIGAILSISAVGVYSVLAYPTIVMTLLANSLGQAKLVQLRSALQANDLRLFRFISRRLNAIVGIVGIPIILAALVGGKPLLDALLGPAYAAEHMAATMLLTAANVGGFATISYYQLISTGNFRHHPMIVGTTAIVGLPPVWFLTQGYGLVGASAGMTWLFSVQWLLTTLTTKLLIQRAQIQYPSQATTPDGSALG